MAHVVTKKCIGCKDMSCVTVCPCDCFHAGPDMLFIDPECCIDCEACATECPTEAIFPEDLVPEEHFDDIKSNAASVAIYPVVTDCKNNP